jgi:hypothetical protein
MKLVPRWMYWGAPSARRWASGILSGSPPLFGFRGYRAGYLVLVVFVLIAVGGVIAWTLGVF